MKIKRILTATAAAALVITSVFAGGNFKEVQAKDNDTPKKITLGYWESPNGELLTKEIVELTEAKDKLPHQLSGGMQQRAAIARTLATEPEFVLLDEPFSALDALTREKMQEHIRKIWEETGSTFLFITHDVDEALLLGKRLVVMQGNPGRIVSDYKNPLNKYENIDYEQLRQTKEYWKIRQKLIGQIQNDEEKKAEKLIQFG